MKRGKILLGLLFFGIIFVLWGFATVESADQMVNDTAKKIEKQINFPAPYSGITNSTELAIAKIKKGELLIKEGKKNIGTPGTESPTASALINAGLKEIDEGIQMLERVNNAANNSVNISVRNNS